VVEATFHPLVPLRRLRDGLRVVRRIRGRRLLLLHEQGRSWVVEDRCPHRGLPLAKGTFDDGHLWCPGHGFRYDLETGDRVQPPVTGGGRECLRRFPVVVREGRVGVLLDGVGEGGQGRSPGSGEEEGAS
jgi:nitrite reductase/ring-hydroxylating ferredoxin subunit